MYLKHHEVLEYISNISLVRMASPHLNSCENINHYDTDNHNDIDIYDFCLSALLCDSIMIMMIRAIVVMTITMMEALISQS